MISVAVVDDHKLFRQGLSAILNAKDGLEVVEKFESAVALISALPTLKVDVILLDIDMPELSGIEALPQILKIKPKVKVILLTMHLSSAKIQEAVAAKVNGYLLKTTGDEEVALAIKQVMEGKDYFAQEAQASLIESYRQKDDPAFVELTPREKDILKLVCEEYNSNEIAEKLFISIHTAETHRRNILSKTGCKNSIGLVKFAMENKLI